ncbi:hypothetical protein [Variovorax atrisoli]|uniref:hypothetical protein n=1 Tax=Variovorax atrisoli TaxID=3394203 RepID=UPI00339473BD
MWSSHRDASQHFARIQSIIVELARVKPICRSRDKSAKIAALERTPFYGLADTFFHEWPDEFGRPAHFCDSGRSARDSEGHDVFDAPLSHCARTTICHRHYPAILEELVRLKMVRKDPETGTAELIVEGFVPTYDPPNMLAFVGDNGQDHLMADITNVLQRAASMLEGAVHMQGLTLQQCEQFQHKARERWASLHHELVGGR